MKLSWYLCYYSLMFLNKQELNGLYNQLSIKVSIQCSETSPRLSLCLSIKMKILHLLVLVRCALRSTSWLGIIDISKDSFHWFVFHYILFVSCRAVLWQDIFVKVSIILKCYCCTIHSAFCSLPHLHYVEHISLHRSLIKKCKIWYMWIQKLTQAFLKTF